MRTRTLCIAAEKNQIFYYDIPCITIVMLLFLQLFIDGEHIGDGATVVEMNEAGDLEEMLAEFMVKLPGHNILYYSLVKSLQISWYKYHSLVIAQQFNTVNRSICTGVDS